MSTPQDTFVQEALDLLQTLEEVLLELEVSPSDSASVDAAFRALHTLKGSGDMFGFGALAAFTHHFEDAFDRIRDGRGAVSQELIAVALDSRDHLSALLALGADNPLSPELQDSGRALLDRLDKLKTAAAETAADPATDGGGPAGQIRRWEITFAPEPAALKNGFRPDLLWDELAQLGAVTVTASDDDIPPLEALEPGECYLKWHIILKTAADRPQIEDVFLFFMDADISIAELDADPGAPPANADDTADTGANAPAAAPPAAVAKPGSVRVQAHRLDDLMDQLGELVIAQARLKSISDSLNEPRLDSTVEEVEALLTGLRDTTLSIRMLPVSMVFTKFRRVIRDLAVELDKPANLVTEGADTEVDKNIIDSLTEPLVHMIRNAIDHGVEDAQTRRAAGKPETATIRLSASQSGGEVLIAITDDGAGLNTDAIRARAIERGLITAEQDPGADALHQLIFEPGFSTAQSLSSVSGRGVGMDAVRRVVDDLRGTINVRSTPGVGTEVTLRLPLTLAIIDGLLVSVDGDPFVLPLSSVEECVDLPLSETTREEGRSILQIREQLVPYLSLDKLFGYTTSTRPDRRVVIVQGDGQRVGLVIDDILGQLQTVIKPLSSYHRPVEELAGATILGDGSVALILDVNAVVRRAQANAQIAA